MSLWLPQDALDWRDADSICFRGGALSTCGQRVSAIAPNNEQGDRSSGGVTGYRDVSLKSTHQGRSEFAH